MGGETPHATLSTTTRQFVLASAVSYDYQFREWDLHRLMIEGPGHISVAEKTFISYETVHTDIRHIYKMVHVASRRSGEESHTEWSELNLKITHWGIDTSNPISHLSVTDQNAICKQLLVSCAEIFGQVWIATIFII